MEALALAALPWGLSLLASLAILKRYAVRDGTLAMPLYHDRRHARRDHWLTRQDLAPMFRPVEVPASGAQWKSIQPSGPAAPCFVSK